MTQIDEGAFKDSDIKEVTIGENIKKIQPKAFKDAGKLKIVNINAKKIKKVGAKAFEGIADGAVIKIKGSAKYYKKTVKKFKKSGVSDTVKFKRVKSKKK